MCRTRVDAGAKQQGRGPHDSVLISVSEDTRRSRREHPSRPCERRSWLITFFCPPQVWLYSQRSVSIAWASVGEPEQITEIFPAQSPLNLVKVLTCFRPTSFTMRAL